jgi:hypothetical protein
VDVPAGAVVLGAEWAARERRQAGQGNSLFYRFEDVFFISLFLFILLYVISTH